MQKEIIKEKLEMFKKVIENCPELVYFGEKVLREKSTDTDLKEGLEIAEKLKKVLLGYREATGLGRAVAAPQIGISKKVVVSYVEDKFETYINPKILERSESKNFLRELCMSSTVMCGDVKRSEKIKMEWTDENGARDEKEFDGFMARLLQHEYDHLEGIVNLDICERGSIEFVVTDLKLEKLRKEHE